ncbi:uncharacterized protein [Lolium perenne]|uniref:uncharacterized protein isoform X4 n=1 Tax=Lolium perenne TaxID=4522 RepID=UPI0021F5EF3B|nr:uncharacterized protein LOC127313231 isoform X4 [Lolium perenne]
MLQEQPVQYGPLGDDGDGINRAWPVEKRRRKCSPPSSSNAPAAQDNQDPISPATDMEGIIKDNHLPLDTSDPEQQENEQEIWGPDVEISPEDAANYTKCLAPDIPPIYKRSSMTTEEEEDLNLRLARYRIAYYKNVAEPELARKLKDPEDYSVEELQENRYFLHFDTHPSFEGCFHPVDTWVAELNDYQRLLVFNGSRDCSDSLYIYWEDYHAYYHTYEVDDAYVKFYGELSSKIKWIKEHVDLDENSEKWEEVGTRAGRQALRIASRFANLSASLVRMAFYEYISELREDKVVEDWSLFYFEVWKLNALKKVSHGSLRDAVKEAYEMDKFGFECERMDAESNATSISFFEQKFKFLASEGGITENTKEGEVLDLFRKIVIKKLKPKNMAMYAQKKLEIAKLMKLIPSSQDVSGSGASRSRICRPRNSAQMAQAAYHEIYLALVDKTTKPTSSSG